MPSRSQGLGPNQGSCTTCPLSSLQRGPFWAEMPGAVPKSIRLPGLHLLPPRPVWLFLWIWLERKPVPGRYALTHPLWALTQTASHKLALDSGPDLHTKPSLVPCSPNQCPLHPACHYPGPSCTFVAP